MTSVKSYLVLQRDTVGDLEDRVLEALKHGWQPLGGVAAGPHPRGGCYYLQAMVMYATGSEA